ncbi:MAG TPA: phage tail protein [Rhizomicrobium sp.]
MNAMTPPGSGLTPAQQALLHVGTNSALPFDPAALVLYARAGHDADDGFAVGTGDHIDIADGQPALVLAQTPGTRRQLTEPSGSFGGLKTPTNVAIDTDGNIFLTDRGNGLVKYFDPCDCAFKPLPCFSAQRPAPDAFVPLNRLSDPAGLAIWGNNLLVADPGNHRIVAIGLAGMVPRSALRLPASSGLQRQWRPYGIAVDSQHRIYISDPDLARLDVFGRDGRWITCWSGLGAVRHLAVDCDDRLFAVADDASLDSSGAPAPGAMEVVDGRSVPLDSSAAKLRACFARRRIAVDPLGNLHLGAHCNDRSDAVFDLQGYPVLDQNKIAPLEFATAGTYQSRALDSRRHGCVWHRVVLAGSLPERTRVDIRTMTSDVELSLAELADLPDSAWSDNVSIRDMPDGASDALVRSPPGRYLWLRLALAGDGNSTPAIARIVIEFPRVSLRRYLPAVFGMDPIAADFTDRFTALFDTTLRSIESRIDTLSELFDPRSAPAERPVPDPGGAPTIDFLSWLATWIGVTIDSHWPEATRRAMLRAATQLYTLRGTYVGVRQLLLTFLGFDRRSCDSACGSATCSPVPLNCRAEPKPCQWKMPPLILEHFRLRRWLFVGHGRLGEDAKLWGSRIVNRSRLSGNGFEGTARLGPLACPPDGRPATQLVSTPDPLRDPLLVDANIFSVFVPASVRQRNWQRRGLERLLAQEAPAFVKYQIEYVEPRFRVGVQAMVGLDSVIARIPDGMRLNDNQLGQGSVLPPRPRRPSAIGINARVGETMRLA